MRLPRTFACLTHHGTLLCCDRRSGRLVHRRPGHLQPHEVPAELHPDLHPGHGAGLTGLAVIDPDDAARAGGRLLGRFEVIPGPRGRIAHLRRAGLFLCAEPGGGFAVDRTEPLGWESFVLLDPAQMRALAHVGANRWVLRDGGTVIEPDSIGFGSAFGWRFGPQTFDLAAGHPIGGVADEMFTAFTPLRDGWRLQPEAVLFRPMVYFAALGEAALFEQLRWSLVSLREVAGYTGHLHIISDRARAEMDQFVPAAWRGSYTLQPCHAASRHEFTAARFAVLDWPSAWQFQPLLYVDTDVAFDAPIEPILARIALGRDLSAQMEDFARLHAHAPAGALLFQADGYDPGEHARGVNSGVIGIPSLEANAGMLRLCRDVAWGWQRGPGAEALWKGDQPAVNYVLHRRAAVDHGVVTPHVAVGGPEPPTTLGPRVGLVHFWAAGPQARKAAAMEAYVRLLLQHRPDGGVAAPDGTSQIDFPPLFVGA